MNEIDRGHLCTNVCESKHISLFFKSAPKFDFCSQEECYFDCQATPCVPGLETFVEDLSCIRDCFENSPDNCLTALLDDVISNGVCRDTGLYPVNNGCQFGNFTGTFFGNPVPVYGILSGTCSPTTEALLKSDQCLRLSQEEPGLIREGFNKKVKPGSLSKLGGKRSDSGACLA